MLAKGGNNIWNSRRKVVQNGNELKDDIWPELEKSNHFQREGLNKEWPHSNKANSIKKDAVNHNRESVTSHPGRCQNINDGKGSSIVLTSSTSTGVNLISQGHNNKVKTLNNVKAEPNSNTSGIENSGEESRNISSKEERKLIHKNFCKAKKEAMRQEKKRQKEEDFLRKMVAPKGISISVIDNETFSKISKSEILIKNTNSYSEVSTESDMHHYSSAFPELSPSTKSTSTKSFGSYGSNIKFSAAASKVPINHELQPNNVEKNGEVSVQRSVKHRKKKDPVVVDILKAIEICKSDKKAVKVIDTGIVLPKKKEKPSIPIIGNILDSSNPVRHRGKKREVPKKRYMTRLKREIIAERERRRRQREISKENADSQVSQQMEMTSLSSIVNSETLVPFKTEVPAVTSVHTDSGCVQKIKIENQSDSNLGYVDSTCEKNIELSSTKLETDVEKVAKEKLHNRKFREYCNHSKSKELSETVKIVLQDIIKFQDRLYINQPIKAEAHRRYVVGLRQTHNLLFVQKVKFIVMAQDIEQVPSPGGLDDLVNAIIDIARKQNVPTVFPFPRRILGKVTLRKVGVSCVGVLNYQGTEKTFQRMVEILEEAKKEYMVKFEEEKSRIMDSYGILREKNEEKAPDNVVQPLKVEPTVTLPLLQKLTEAISEICMQSTSQKDTE